MFKIKVILNKIKEIETSEIPKELKVTNLGESPAIYTSDGYPTKRVQGLTLEISGEKEAINAFLKKYEPTGVYTDSK